MTGRVLKGCGLSRTIRFFIEEIEPKLAQIRAQRFMGTSFVFYGQALFYGTSFERVRLLAAPYMRFKTWMRERGKQSGELKLAFLKFQPSGAASRAVPKSFTVSIFVVGVAKDQHLAIRQISKTHRGLRSQLTPQSGNMIGYNNPGPSGARQVRWPGLAPLLQNREGFW
jgi:hypothetical protein